MSLHNRAAAFGRLEHELRSHDNHVAYVGLGAAHSAVLTDDGLVYSWGWSDLGQLGHGVRERQDRPTLVEGLLFPPEDTQDASTTAADKGLTDHAKVCVLGSFTCGGF